MEIALGGIVLLIVLLPGISFRKGYFSEEFSNQYTIRDFFVLFVNTLFPSLIIYLIFLPIIYFGFGYFYDFKTLLGILSSNETLVKSSIYQIDNLKFEIIAFQIVINSTSFILGYKIRDYVLDKSIDARYKFFRYKNIWHYLLTGKFILFKRSQIKLNKDKVEDIDITYIDSVVSIGGETNFYSGVLVDYELSDDGNLELLYLKDASKKSLEESDFKKIEGHTLVLKYDNIINLNIVFIQIEENEDGVVLRKVE